MTALPTAPAGPGRDRPDPALPAVLPTEPGGPGRGRPDPALPAVLPTAPAGPGRGRPDLAPAAALPAELPADLLTELSHELRTPLASIVGYAEILTGPDPALDRATVRMLDAVRRNAARMSRVLDSLSALADLDRGDIPRQRVPVDLGALLADLPEVLADEAARREVTVAVPVSGGLPTVLGDPATLRLALLELTVAAVVGADPGGLVEVTGAPAAGELVITGTGDRAESDGRPPGSGRRIGTAVAYGIVAAHGGRIRTTGAGMAITLPAAPG